MSWYINSVPIRYQQSTDSVSTQYRFGTNTVQIRYQHSTDSVPTQYPSGTKKFPEGSQFQLYAVPALFNARIQVPLFSITPLLPNHARIQVPLFSITPLLPNPCITESSRGWTTTRSACLKYSRQAFSLLENLAVFHIAWYHDLMLRIGNDAWEISPCVRELA